MDAVFIEGGAVMALRRDLTEEEQAFVSGVEFALDWMLYVSAEDLARYHQLVG